MLQYSPKTCAGQTVTTLPFAIGGQIRLDQMALIVGRLAPKVPVLKNKQIMGLKTAIMLLLLLEWRVVFQGDHICLVT